MENDIVAICSGYREKGKIIPCSKIKIDKDVWKTENEVMRDYPELYLNYQESAKNKTLSHGICPECYNITMKQMDEEDAEKSKPNDLVEKVNTGFENIEADPRIFS